MTSPLRALVDIITTQVESLESAYTQAGLGYPSLDEPFRPSPLDRDPSVAESRRLIVAAASQLIATTRSPIDVVQEASTALLATAALSTTEETNVADILVEAGPQGLHVKEIAVASGVEQSYLARILRYLATRHIFKEISPNVYTNNRISSLLAKGKTVSEIKADPIARYDKAPFAAFVSAFGGEAIKAAQYLSPFVQNKLTVTAPFNAAHNTSKPSWEWFEEPGNEWQARRIAVLMTAAGSQFPPQLFTDAVGTAGLKPGDVVVDVGGGVGSATLELVKEHPHLQYVVQDLDKQITAAQPYWEKNAPEALKDGKVKLQVHDFFSPQPVKNAGAYFLRFILHDWPDSEAKKILSHLRAAAGPSTKLIAFDHLAEYTCETPLGSSNNTPYPLLPNYGVAGAGFATGMDLGVLIIANGKERTRDDFEELGAATGWKLESIKPGKLATVIYSVV